MQKTTIRPAYPAQDAAAKSAAGGGRSTPCPSCRGELYRVPRRLMDRIQSVFVPVHRYRCMEMGCAWEGKLRRELGCSASAPRQHMLEPSRMGPPRS
jgi:hypothetical protein